MAAVTPNSEIIFTAIIIMDNNTEAEINGLSSRMLPLESSVGRIKQNLQLLSNCHDTPIDSSLK